MLKRYCSDADMTKIERAKDMFFNFDRNLFQEKEKFKESDISKMSSKERDALIREIPTRVWRYNVKEP
nr:MAG: hypothetical protein CM15mV30_0470 [uncultured marine virus]